jgi:ribosome biogenesis GTPase / thiamine phosphate phosphatase
MKLIEIGYNDTFEKFRIENNIEKSETGRVIAEYKERYIVRTAEGEYEAEVTGNMRFAAQGRENFPAVGDWVALTIYDSDFALIHKILPRVSIIKRQAVGQFGEIQIIAANIDYAFIVQAVDRDFNINRLERYLTICNSSKVSPVIILSKTDLIDEQRISEISGSIKSRIKDIPVIAVSNESRSGYETIKEFMEKGKTYCMLGSSGVGKSTLINNLSGKTIMRTDSISQSTNKGKHVTTHRELIVLENGAILIDNPGMKEVGITDSTDGLEITFDMIVKLSGSCKYHDCTHTGENGCAVIEAVDKGEIDKDSYNNFLKMEKEKAHFESTIAEKRKKDKDFGKMLKNYKKDINKSLLILLVALTTFSAKGFGQEFSGNSLKTGVGLGITEGLRETGVGGVVSFGYQKSVLNDRVRINPYFMTGGFLPFGITDTRDQYFRVTSLGVNGYLDVIKIKSLSLFLGAGGLMSYSRGLLGTGGFPEEGSNSSEYFFKLYGGGYLGAGFRINPPDRKIAYELTPINFYFGNDGFFMSFLEIGVDIKLRKK